VGVSDSLLSSEIPRSEFPSEINVRLVQRKYYQLDSLEAIGYKTYHVQLGSKEF
jgi:hypothetical protein